jgi:hypothetical protein
MTRGTLSSGATPYLSVVVTIVDGGDALRRFLAAIMTQTGAPPMEILVPFDDSVSYVGEWQAEYPAVRFMRMGARHTLRGVATPSGQHDLIDQRRAAGLGEAQGELIAILEDRSPPGSDWASSMERLHRELPDGVIGGVIACSAQDDLNWSLWACDFGRYAPGSPDGPRAWISDVNVCYKRRCVEMTRDLWSERFNEARMHWRLRERGETLYLSNAAVVHNETNYRSLSGVLRERFQWGRSFGCARAGHASPVARLGYILGSPLIPFVLFTRHWRTQQRLGNGGRFVRAARYVFPVLFAWSAGEAWGAVTRRW